jgi:hypothetical protein
MGPFVVFVGEANELRHIRALYAHSGVGCVRLWDGCK